MRLRLHGIDEDLQDAFEYNSCDISLKDIKGVCLAISGANDSIRWWWIVLLNNGLYQTLNGWCDYTGWD